jgi:Protein of unknown function (DUF2867)
MRASPVEYRGLHLRAHELLHDVPLEDVWAIPLQGGGPGRTIRELSVIVSAALVAAPAVVKSLFRLRFRIGALFKWDRPRPAWNTESYVHRLTAADRARSTVEPGTLDGRFSVLYRFESEQLSELRNSTVHGFVSLSMRPTADGYLAYLAIFVKPVHRFTRLYMTAIAPFRRLVVYPVIIRAVQREWARRHGKGP